MGPNAACVPRVAVNSPGTLNVCHGPERPNVRSDIGSVERVLFRWAASKESPRADEMGVAILMNHLGMGVSNNSKTWLLGMKADGSQVSREEAAIRSPPRQLLSLRSPPRLRLLASLVVSPTRPSHSPCPPRLPTFLRGRHRKSARVTDRIGTSFFLLIYFFRVTLRVSSRRAKTASSDALRS